MNKGKRSKNLHKSEISDKCDTTEPDTENISNKTDDSKSRTGKNGRNKGKGFMSKNKVDAYMKQRGKKWQLDETNGDGSAEKSEISDSKQRMKTRSQKQLEHEENDGKGDETKSTNEKDDEEDDDYFSCKVCSQTFKNHTMFKKHKVSCMKIKKRHSCSKCGKSFSQPSLLTQHFDYRHTDKPKKFVCTPCGKSF